MPMPDDGPVIKTVLICAVAMIVGDGQGEQGAPMARRKAQAQP